MVQGIELTSENFYKVESLFEELKHHLSIKGVISGAVSGRVFVSNDYSTALLINPQGIFLGGSPDNSLFFEEANKLLKEELLPQLASDGELDYVLFYPSDEKWWAGTLEVVMKDLLPMRSGRMTFTHDLSNIDDHTDKSIVPVNGSLLKRQDLIGLDDVIHEILEGWPH